MGDVGAAAAADQIDAEFLDEADGPKVTLAANTWTQLTLTFTPTAKQAYESPQINFSGTTKNTTINYDDMSLTTP